MSRKKRARHHRTRAETNRMRALFHEHLLAGGEPKAFAMDHGIRMDTGWVYRWAAQLGWSSFYVTKEEKARIIARRRNQAAAFFDSAT